MNVYGIDPGARESAVVTWDGEKIVGAYQAENYKILFALRETSGHVVAIEQIRGYGIVAGDDTFDTCEWAGRFAEAANHCQVIMLPRKEIKKHLCGNTTTNDKYIRQALIDRIGPQGTKKAPGPTFGIAGHLWAALACAITAADKLKEG